MGTPYGVSERPAQGVSVSLTRQLSFRGPTIVLIVALLWLLHGILPLFVAGLGLLYLLMIATAVVAFCLI